MAYPVKGRNVMLEVYSDVAGDYVYFTCAESVSLNISPEKVNLTTMGLGRGFKDKERRRGWSISLNGVSDIQSEGRTIFTMIDPASINEVYSIRLSFEDSLGNTAVVTGEVNLGETNINNPETGFSDYAMELIGQGVYDLVQSVGGVIGGGFLMLAENGDTLIAENTDTLIQENG